MCVGGVSALRHTQHPRVTALLRVLSGPETSGGRARTATRAAGVLPQSGRAGVASDGRERGRAAACKRPVRRGDLRCAAGRAAADVGGHRATASPRRLRRLARSPSLVWSLGAAGLSIASVTGAARRGCGTAGRAHCRLPRHRRARRAARIHAGTDVAHLSSRHWRSEPDHPADQDSRRRRLFRPARDPALHRRRRPDGGRRNLGTHGRLRDGHRRPGARRSGDGGGRCRNPVLGNLRIDDRRRLGDQLAARAVDATRRLFGCRIGQHRRCGFGDGNPRAAVPDDGGARIARQSVDRDVVSRRLPAGIRAGAGTARPHRAASTATELAGQRRVTRADVWRAAAARRCQRGLPILLFGGIFSGLTTVTEAALLAVVYSLVAGIAMGGIKRTELVGQLAQSGVVTSTTLWVLAAASAFAWILVREWVPQMLGEWIRGRAQDGWSFWR